MISMVKNIIVIVGPIASGKGTLVELLKEAGYVPYSFSDRIKEELKKRGLELSRATLNSTANDIRQKEGADALSKRNADVIDKGLDTKIIVDGARNPAEIKFFQEKYGARVIGITADQNVRFQRLRSRGIKYETLTEEQFDELDDRENNQTGEFAQNINECLKLTDNIIDNNGSIEELKTKVEEFLKE